MNKTVILAGYGIIASGAEREFYTYIDKAQAPVLLTWKSIGLLDNDHPLYCGRPGGIGQRAANTILQDCDTLIVLGAKMDHDQVVFQLQNIAPNAFKVVVDIDIAEMNKYPHGWARVQMNVKDYLCQSIPPECSPEWLAYCKKLNIDNPVFNPDWWREEPVNYYCFLDELNRLSRNDDVICPEMSSPAQALFQSWRVKQGQRFTYAGALGAMGSGIPLAIGAAVATGRRVLCPVGDGGFMLNIQELEVIKRLSLPVKLFVLDNGGYAAIQNTQNAYFDGRHVGCDKASGLTLPNASMLALAFDINTRLIETNTEIKHVLPRVMANDEPEVVVVRVPADFKLTMRVRSKMVNGKPTYQNLKEI